LASAAADVSVFSAFLAALVAFSAQACAAPGLAPGVYRLAGKRHALVYPLTRRVSAVALWRSLS